MPLPTPVPGLVIRYSYLWHHEHLEGRDEGQKDRPCAIVAAVRRTETGDTEVLVLPITHTPPDRLDSSVELPAAIKSRLGLDNAPSWVVISEWNAFVWPGPDLRRLPGHDGGTVAYGMLPPGLFSTIRERFLDLIRRRGGQPVSRT